MKGGVKMLTASAESTDNGASRRRFAPSVPTVRTETGFSPGDFRHDAYSSPSSAATTLRSSFFSPRRMFFETAAVETSNSSASVDSVASRGDSK